MLQATMGALLTGSLVPPGNEYIYIIRSGSDVMYIGKTNGPNRRMEEHYVGVLSTFARNDRRDILRWTVELREVEECREYIPPKYKLIDIDVAERCAIQALRPILNTTHNFHPSPMPERYKELFEMEAGATDNLF